MASFSGEQLHEGKLTVSHREFIVIESLEIAAAPFDVVCLRFLWFAKQIVWNPLVSSPVTASLYGHSSTHRSPSNRLLMSIVLLIRRYNVIAPGPPRPPPGGGAPRPGRGAPPNWLATERSEFARSVSRHLDETVRLRTCVVFDAQGARHDRPNRFDHQGSMWRFAVDHPESRRLLEEINRRPHHARVTLASCPVDSRVRAARKKKTSQACSTPTLVETPARRLTIDLLGTQTQNRQEKMPQESRENEPRPSQNPSLTQSRSAEHHAEMKSMRQSTRCSATTDLKIC